MIIPRPNTIVPRRETFVPRRGTRRGRRAACGPRRPIVTAGTPRVREFHRPQHWEFALSFASGSLSFVRFAVVGNSPGQITEEILEKFAPNTVLLEADGVVPDDENWGWCGGRHVLDGEFSFEANVYNDCVHVGLRIDTHRPPGDVKRAYLMMEEQAAATPDGFISKAAKRDAKDAAMRKLDDEKREGRFRKSKMTPILWDVKNSTPVRPERRRRAGEALRDFRPHVRPLADPADQRQPRVATPRRHGQTPRLRGRPPQPLRRRPAGRGPARGIPVGGQGAAGEGLSRQRVPGVALVDDRNPRRPASTPAARAAST